MPSSRPNHNLTARINCERARKAQQKTRQSQDNVHNIQRQTTRATFVLSAIIAPVCNNPGLSHALLFFIREIHTYVARLTKLLSRLGTFVIQDREREREGTGSRSRQKRREKRQRCCSF